MNYPELTTAIADFLNRDDLTAQIPTFVRLAEARLDRDVDHWAGEKRVTLTGGGVRDLPADYIAATRVWCGGPVALTTQDDLQVKRDSYPGATGKASFWAVVGGQAEFFPDTTDDVDMAYRASIPPLDEMNVSNWLLARAPDAYLYGSLIASAPYLQEDSRLTVWAELYASAVAALNAGGRAGRWPGKLVMHNA